MEKVNKGQNVKSLVLNKGRRHDTHHNDIYHNDIKHKWLIYDTQQHDTQFTLLSIR